MNTLPLGPNVTRGGRRARVICNCLNSPRFHAVYVLVEEDGTEHSPTSVNDQGSYLNSSSMPHESDLVGHLTQPLVQLGDTVTRDGRKARVICIDRNERTRPVVALVTNSAGTEEYTNYYTLEGLLSPKRGPHCLDLVGHLPPDPAYVERELDAFLAECKTWEGATSESSASAAMIRFAKRAKGLQLLRSKL